MEATIKKGYWGIWCLLALLILFIYSQSASAFTVNWAVYDFNTLNPVSNTTVKMDNGSYSVYHYTDSSGFAETTTDAGIYELVFTKTGYSPYLENLNITGNVSQEIYMMPRSHAGIIRVKIVDLTLGDHESCFFYSNNRYLGCFKSNDTVVLHTNMNYTWQPVIGKTDMFSNPTNISRYIWYYFGAFIGLIVLAIIIGLIGFIFIRLLRK